MILFFFGQHLAILNLSPICSWIDTQETYLMVSRRAQGRVSSWATFENCLAGNTIFSSLWWGNIKEQSDCTHHTGQHWMVCRASQWSIEERGNICRISQKWIRCVLKQLLSRLLTLNDTNMISWSLETFTGLTWWTWWCLILPLLMLPRVTHVLVSTVFEQSCWLPCADLMCLYNRMTCSFHLLN